MDGATFSIAELQSAAAGVWQGDLSVLPERIGISTDTRSDGTGKIFFALAGENFDAHDFLDKAAASGCCALCIRKDFDGAVPDLPKLRVDDVLTAFQRMAGFHRLRFPELCVAGITGSVGKTSTKEMLRAIFAEYTGDENAVLYTLGNTNNHIGVPQNLFRLNSSHRFAVIEMGTSSPGEIEPLSRMALPFAAAVNTVAGCHLEKLRSLDGVAAEKSTVYCGLPEDGVAVMGSDVHGRGILERASGTHRRIIFGTDPEKCDVAAVYQQGSLEGSSFELIFSRSGNCYQISWQLSGAHQAQNAACAAALALGCGVPEAAIASGLKNTSLPGMRMKRTNIGGVEFINDAYNANPASMRALFSLLKNSVAPDKLVLVLGGMRELGESSRAEHTALLEIAAREFPGARLFTIGREFSGIPGNGNHFPESSAALDAISALLRPGDTVAAKGSRGNRVELALPEDAR